MTNPNEKPQWEIELEDKFLMRTKSGIFESFKDFCRYLIDEMYYQGIKNGKKEYQRDIQSVLNMLSGIEDEKARKIENYIKEYMIK